MTPFVGLTALSATSYWDFLSICESFKSLLKRDFWLLPLRPVCSGKNTTQVSRRTLVTLVLGRDSVQTHNLPGLPFGGDVLGVAAISAY